MSSELKSLK
jgi:hypothetical protein